MSLIPSSDGDGNGKGKPDPATLDKAQGKGGKGNEGGKK